MGNQAARTLQCGRYRTAERGAGDERLDRGENDREGKGRDRAAAGEDEYGAEGRGRFGGEGDAGFRVVGECFDGFRRRGLRSAGLEVRGCRGARARREEVGGERGG